MSDSAPPPAPRRTLAVPSTASDRFYDYCLQPYDPRAVPADARPLRGESLLWVSLEAAAIPHDRDRIFHAIQGAVGRDLTVFGVKWADGQLSWELYFYDPTREDPRVSPAGLRRALAGTLELLPEVSGAMTAASFMASFDLDRAALRDRRVDELNLYLPDYAGQGGCSYALRGGRSELRNTYRFYHPKREIEAILHRIRHTVHVDLEAPEATALAAILLPELYECARICVAKKRFADAIYFSGISVDQLRWFLRRFAYPAAIQDFVARHRHDLAHLRFDVGIDYHSADGRLVSGKTGYYSTL